MNTPQNHNETSSLKEAFFERVTRVISSYTEVVPVLEKVFPPCDTLPKTLQQLDELKLCLDSFRPLNTEQVSRLQEAWDTEYTYESNRIEGNTLTLQETHMVIAQGMTIKGKSLDEHLEARNHQEAIHYIRDLASKNTLLSEYLVNSIHSLVLGGIKPHDAGKYRTGGVLITGSKHVPPQAYIVPKKMEEVFQWYQEQKDHLHPVLLASEMHRKIVTVHPWIDGNGRISRLVMNLVLLQKGFPIARISGDDEARLAYYEALETAQVADNTNTFHMLVASYVKKSFLEFLAILSGDMSEEGKEKGEYFFRTVFERMK